MTGSALLTEILTILMGGFTSIGSSMGGALSSFASAIMITGTGESATLSTFAILVIVMASIGLALGLFRWVLNVFTSFGNRNR